MQPEKKDSLVYFPCPVTNRGQPGFIQATPSYLLYFNGPTVVLQSLNADIPSLYVNHLANVSAAKFSNHYRYIASVDDKGTLMIHCVENNKISLYKKYEGFYMGAKCIDWTADHNKICVVGSGKGRYGRVASIENGSDVGDITAVTANLTAASFRTERPYRLTTGGDQYTIKIYQGPPYKFTASKKTHTNFINQLKHNPDGTILASVSSDRKIVLYDGKTSQVIKQKNQAHEAGIMGVAWLDSENFITVSSDKHIKFWNTALQLLNTVPITQSEIQIKLLDTFIVAVSYCRETQKIYCLLLSGEIKQFSKEGKYIRSFEGWKHMPLKTLSHKNGSIFVIDSKGKIIEVTSNGQIKRRAKQYQCINKVFIDACVNQNYLFVLTGQSTVLTLSLNNQNMQQCQQYRIQTKVSNTRFISSVDETDSSFICYNPKKIQIFSKSVENTYKVVTEAALKVEPTCVYRSKSSGICYSGSMKGLVQVFQIKEGNKIENLTEFQNTPNRVCYMTQFGQNIFVGDSTGAIKVWKLQEGKIVKVDDSMTSHTTAITEILVSGQFIYSFSMDNSYSKWNLEKFMRKSTEKDVHKFGILSAVMLDSGRFLTSGGDYLLKIHTI